MSFTNRSSPGKCLLFWFVMSGFVWACSSDPNRVAARVGKQVILENDIVLRIKVEQTYGNVSIEPYQALVLLIGDAIEGELARELQIVPSEMDLIQYERFVQRTSEDPDRLRALRVIFAEDSIGFRKHVLLPALLRNRNREAFYAADSLHELSYDRAERTFNLARVGLAFLDISHLTGAEYETQLIDRNPESPSSQLLEDETSVIYGSEFFSLAEGLGDGVLYPSIIDLGNSFSVMKRLNKPKTDRMRIEVLTIPRTTFEDFSAQRIADIKVILEDRKMEERIRSGYPGLPWL